MSTRTHVGHGLLKRLVNPGRQRFARDLNQLEQVQRQQLSRWLATASRAPYWQKRGVKANWTWEAFTSQVPWSSYADYAQTLNDQRTAQQALLMDSPVARYQPTSGSTSAVKWIPYTKLFLNELDDAISAWVGDLYEQFPGQGKGRHYWSLSWIPTHLRAETAGDINDDMKMLSWGKRLLTYLTQAVPQEVAQAETLEDSLFGTVSYLCADRQLGFISVWSPTFGINVLEYISSWRQELATVLQQGRWGRRADRMAGVRCPRSAHAARLLSEWDGQLTPDFFQRLWPTLALVSAWDTAAAAPWARSLQSKLPHAAFQGKGLWATEGVVTIPFQGRFPLAYRSHVYEFIDLQDHRVLAPWQLKDGQEVMPVITTGSGLARYRMNDVLKVSGFLGQVPCLDFLGRNDGVDLVGEKISATTAQTILDTLPLGSAAMPVTLLALDELKGGRPGYVLLAECATEPDAEQARALSRHLEQSLQDHFHYKLARELGQLQEAQCVLRQDMRDIYLGLCRDRGMIDGNIKVEPLRHWPGPTPEALRPLLQA